MSRQSRDTKYIDEALALLVSDIQKRYIFKGKVIEVDRVEYITLRPPEDMPDLISAFREVVIKWCEEGRTK